MVSETMGMAVWKLSADFVHKILQPDLLRHSAARVVQNMHHAKNYAVTLHLLASYHREQSGFAVTGMGRNHWKMPTIMIRCELVCT